MWKTTRSPKQCVDYMFVARKYSNTDIGCGCCCCICICGDARFGVSKLDQDKNDRDRIDRKDRCEDLSIHGEEVPSQVSYDTIAWFFRQWMCLFECFQMASGCCDGFVVGVNALFVKL